MEEKIIEKKRDSKTSVIIILAVLVFILCGVLAYFILFDEKDNKGTINNKVVNNSNIKTNVKDYIILTETDNITIDHGKPDCYGSESLVETNKLKKISFKNLPAMATWQFELRNIDFINRLKASAGKETELSNSFAYEIYNNILSIYVVENASQICEKYSKFDAYSLNINLKNNKVITNKEMLEMFNINISDVYKDILNSIVLDLTNAVPSESFPNLYFDRTERFLPFDEEGHDLTEIRKNIDNYVEYISNRHDQFVLYIKDGKLFVSYDTKQILSLLGWSTALLSSSINTFQLN